VFAYKVEAKPDEKKAQRREVFEANLKKNYGLILETETKTVG
jgi:hypothetical protein